ncbi:MAG TPA: ABC transporter substrate-binding protein [Candidatus Limnocylindria bacterium]|nr:ABC transporter substrate-binding protein [Candidatus Limnocylindria bacterium]
MRETRHYRLTRRQFLGASSAAVLAACAPAAAPGGGTQTGAPTAAVTATAGPALKIGQLLPFTRVYAELGASMKRATDLYVKQAGGRLANRPVQLIYEDEANDPQVGLQKMQKFIDQDRVDVAMGIVATPILYAVRNVVDQSKLIFIATNAGGNAATREMPNCQPSCKSRYVFRSSFSAYQVSHPFGEHLSKKGEKEFFAFYSNYGFGTESAAAFKQGLEVNGGKITGELKPALGNTDWVPFVTQVKGQPTKNVYSFFSGTDAIGYVKAWNQLGMTAAGYKMYGAGFLTEQDVIKEVGAQIPTGTQTSLFWSLELDNAENKRFVEDYKKEYNLEPDTFAVQAWDGIKALDEALKKTGGNTNDKEALIAALEGVSFKSPRGDFSFDKSTHNVIHDMYLREIRQVGGRTVNAVVEKIGRAVDPGKPT